MPDAVQLPPLSVTVARRRRGVSLTPELRQRLQRICDIEAGAASLGPRLRDGAADHESIWSITASALFGVLDVVGRDRALVAVVWLTHPNQRRLAATHAVDKARKRADGLWVAQPQVAPPALVVADGLFSLHLAALRNRTPNQWRAVDARRQYQTVTEAAQHLGCSSTSLSHTLTRANVKVTSRTRVALDALLALTVPSLRASVESDVPPSISSS